MVSFDIKENKFLNEYKKKTVNCIINMFLNGMEENNYNIKYFIITYIEVVFLMC